MHVIALAADLTSLRLFTINFRLVTSPDGAYMDLLVEFSVGSLLQIQNDMVALLNVVLMNSLLCTS